MTTTDTRVGGYIVTYTGRRMYALDPRPEEIDIDDIAWALAHQCRFSGHTSEFYSVAQHSCHVHDIVHGNGSISTDDMKAWGLFHDASEAYLVDIPRPIKRSAGSFGEIYMEVEDQLMKVIARRFDLTGAMPPAVKDADVLLLVTEQRDLMKDGGDGFGQFGEAEPLDFKIRGWDPERAYEEFKLRASLLGRV